VEEEDVSAEAAGPEHPHPTAYPGSLRRLLLRGILLGLAIGAAALLIWGLPAAVGAAAGSLAAAVYCWGYLRSHVGHAGRTRIFDPALARHSAARIGTLALVAVGMRLAGRMPFIGYLSGFAVAFAVLVALEAPAVARQLRANGVVG
jgi:hypothetical protein